MDTPQVLTEYSAEIAECVQDSIYNIDEIVEKRELTIVQYAKFLELLSIQISGRLAVAKEESDRKMSTL